jgi:integrase
MSVKLRKRKNTDGTVSLRLDIHHNGERWYESLDGLKLSKGNTLIERENNKKNLKLAEAIRHTKSVELSASDYNIITSTHKQIEVVKWMDQYISEYTKKDIRNMMGAKNRFKVFVSTKNHKVTFGNIDALLIESFVDYLEKNSEGEGASSYYARFKKMLNHACRKKLMSYSVLAEVKKRPKGRASKRDILTLDELELVARTPIESPEIRRAAMFSAVTGLAWVDIKILVWKNVKHTYKKLEFVRTKQEDYNESVIVPLNDTALLLLGEPQNSDEPVFNLPSANGANKTLKKWVKRAGIDKTITWHNLRHSFGTNLILNRVDLLTTAKLMGHSSTKHTIRYVKASEEMQRTGTEKINIKLDL